MGPICHSVGNTVCAKCHVNFHNFIFVLCTHVQLAVVCLYKSVGQPVCGGGEVVRIEQCAEFSYFSIV